MSRHDVWTAALLDPDAPVPPGLTTWNHSDPKRRLDVHRNNVVVSLVDALAQSFPVAQQWAGEDFFRAMCRQFVRTCPPRTRVLAHYGGDLPAFIEAFAPAQSLPSLADLVRLEYLRWQALHAADALPMAAAQWTALLQDPVSLTGQRWSCHPSVHLFCSAHPVVSIWAAHQDGSSVAWTDIDMHCGESAWVFRSGLEVMVLPTPRHTAGWLSHLQGGGTLADATEAALNADASFDLSQALALLVRHGLVTGTIPPKDQTQDSP